MKRFLLNLFFFSLLFVAISAIIEYRLDKNINNHYELQYQEAIHNTQHADCIIIGASHATNGIRPSILDSLGITFYNFSLGGSSPQFYYHWYTHIFSHFYQTPSYCIYAVDWKMFDDSSKWRKYEQDSEYFPFTVFSKNLLQPWEYNTKTLLFNRWCLLKYNNPNNLQYVFQKKIDYAPYLIDEYDNGFVPYELDSLSRNRKFGGTHYQCRVTAEMQYYFEELIKTVMKKNIKLIFVDPPESGGSKEVYESMPAYAILDSLCNTYAIPFLNYNTDKRSYINTDLSLYTDWDHLNSKGSIAFSKMLSKDLAPLIKK